MAYSKAKLKSNIDRESPFFKPFLIGNISDKFLPTRTLLYVPVRHIFISLTSFTQYVHRYLFTQLKVNNLKEDLNHFQEASSLHALRFNSHWYRLHKLARVLSILKQLSVLFIRSAIVEKKRQALYV
jgi:hypothetical protein